MYHVKAGVSVKLINIIITNFWLWYHTKEIFSKRISFGDYNLVNKTLALDTNFSLSPAMPKVYIHSYSPFICEAVL